MAKFKIGGRDIDVPPLNLKAQRTALRVLPTAFRKAQATADPQRLTDIDLVAEKIVELASVAPDAKIELDGAIVLALVRLATPTIAEGHVLPGDPDGLIGAFLQILEARLGNNPDETLRMSAAQLEEAIEGREELSQLNVSMMELLKESGFKPGEMTPTAEGEEAAPTSAMSTPSSTGSLSPSFEPEAKGAAGT